jgi:hypothetical protein
MSRPDPFPTPDRVPHASRPPASDPLDEAEQLGDEIAILAAHIHAATQRFLELIARFDRLRGWEPAGFRSCAHWLAFRTGLDLGTAREKVRTARALEQLPQVSHSMARGALSFSQVRALTRVATPDNEEELLELAEGTTTAQLERLVRSWKKLSRKDEATLERERHESRFFSVFPDEEGMYLVRGRLDPEVGAVLLRAIEAASDALYRRRRGRVDGRPGPAHPQPDAASPLPVPAHPQPDAASPLPVPAHPQPDFPASAYPYPQSDPDLGGTEAKQRRADAVGLLAERALAAGFGGETRDVASPHEASPHQPDPHEADPREADAGPHGTGGMEIGRTQPPLSGTRAERYQVLLHVEVDTLRTHGAPARSDLEDGTRVSPETSRRLACDAALVRVTHASDGSILDVGRRTRTIPPALRRALEVRDGGCRFPGCGLRFTDAHHIHHWADGGETKLSNTLLVCRAHHRLLHEGGWRVEFWGTRGAPAFLSPRGETLIDFRPPTPPLPAHPVVHLSQDNRARGTDPGPCTAGARWKREADIPDSVLFRALESLE